MLFYHHSIGILERINVLSENKLIPTAKPKEIYAMSVYSSKHIHHIVHATDDEKRKWKARCGRILKSTFKSLVPVQHSIRCARCATSQEYRDFDFYLAECWAIRSREQREKEKERQDKMEARQRALCNFALDVATILENHFDIGKPEHIPGASRIKCKTSTDGHIFEFTISIPI